ncbi:MAG: hypothetical protein K9K32_00135 [Halanaerobiales bacterium]|nr:hypothetical protein [Halanaerobiales bacterium]
MKKKKIMVSQNFFHKIVSLKSDIAEIISFKIIDLFSQTGKMVSVKNLVENMKGLSKIQIYNTLEYMEGQIDFGLPDDTIDCLPLQGEIKSIIKEYRNLGTNKKVSKKKKSKRKKRAEKINKEILNPWYSFLRKHGYKKIITQSYRNFCFGMINKAIKEYDFTYKQLLKILKFGFRNDFLKDKGINTNIKSILFSGANIPQKYLKKKQSKYKIRTHNGMPANSKKFGYFERKNNKFIFKPPKNKKTIHYQVKKETKNRLEGNSKRETFDNLFKDGSLKKKFRWLLGETGENNEFVYGVNHEQN